MTWNYRIVKYRNKSGYGLHEVYYDDQGRPWGMTAEPAGFVSDIKEGDHVVLGQIQTAMFDIEEHPVFLEPAKWPGRAPKGKKAKP